MLFPFRHDKAAMTKPSNLQSNGVAVITGAASGIGLAAARRFAALGLKIALVDLPGDKLEQAAKSVAAEANRAAADIVGFGCDVSDAAQVGSLEAAVRARLGDVTVLMNNAAIGTGSSAIDPAHWQRVLLVNLWGVINGCQTFLPAMLAHGKPALVINTGSKQGITTPPGDPAYNVAKAGVKVFTEALQHQLRNTAGCEISAHLLIPGFVFTGMTAGDRTVKPDAAWTPEQTVGFMVDSLESGDFYILCPDNDVPRHLDEKRIAWAAGDIIENRPPLSRWHADYTGAFADYLKKN